MASQEGTTMGRGLGERLFAWGLAHPDTLFAILRLLKPNVYIKKKKFGIVTRFDDVQEVLERESCFQVPYGKAMTQLAGRNFFLGMQDSPEYTRDTSSMRVVVRRDDLPGIATSVQETASQLVAESGGRLDVVRGLGRRVPTRWVFDYFGLPAPGTPGGPESEQDLTDWTLKCFEFLFLNPQQDAQIEADAMSASDKLRAYLDGAIAQRKQQSSSADDVLGRCLRLQASSTPGMDDEGIRTNLFGIIVGAIPTTAMAAAQALDQLLDRPRELEGARHAARHNDDEMLGRYVFEALRFNPQNPGVLRFVSREYPIAENRLRGRTFPVGTTILVATRSAMHDTRALHAPKRFRLDRPSYHYMHFGHGMHTCFGLHINLVQIPGLLKPLLARRDLARVAGQKGKLQMQGPYPHSMFVEFSGGASSTTHQGGGPPAGGSPPSEPPPTDIRLVTLPPDLDSETTRWMMVLYGLPFVETPHVPVLDVIAWKFHGSKKEEKRQIAENTIEPQPVYVPLCDPLVIADGKKLWNVMQFLDYFESRVPAERRLVPDGAGEEFWEKFHEVWDEYPYAVTKWYYDWMLPFRKPVLHTFNVMVPAWERMLTTLFFPVFRFIVRRALGLSLEATMESERIINKHMAMANEKLSDGRKYLLGDRLTIVDIVFCTTTAPLVGERNYGPLPNTLPTFADMPEEMRRRIKDWAEQPAGQFVKRVYAEHRGRPVNP